MVDNQVPDSSSSNREMGEPSPSQLSPQEERRRQIFLLIGLAVLFAVILAYQVYRLKQISKEAAQK